jgi:hypothetical protein
MTDDKMNLLKKAMGSNSEGLPLGRPNLESTSLEKSESKLPLQASDKFGGQANPTALKALKDPKGKNKQVLKGNAKSKHKR